jgi:8-oxoguanine deaminase
MAEPGTLLITNAAVLVTMDARRAEIVNGGMFIRNGFIEQVAVTPALPKTAEQVVDLAGHVVLPGFVNTHHHLFQAFDRACRDCQSVSMTGWLRGLYPRWDRLRPEDVALATEIGLTELLLSGCTTVADHHYVWPNGTTAGAQFEVARRLGLRFHLGRGFQNIGAGAGGFAPAALLEQDDLVLADCARLIDKFHDPAPGSFAQVYIAPSSLRTVTPDLLRESAALARSRDVRFHMHLGETRGEIDFAIDKFGKRPAGAAEDLGCLMPRSWVAHGVHFNADDVDLLAQHQCGICHCPSSNMRLGSGIAPIQRYRESGLRVSLGVDGSASNDSSNLLAEIRMALLLSRVSADPDGPLLDPRAALEMATLGGADILGRRDIGSLRPGYAADFIAINTDRIELLGAEDPIAALVLCALTRVDHVWVHGRPLVRDMRTVGYDLAELTKRWRQFSTRQS